MASIQLSASQNHMATTFDFIVATESSNERRAWAVLEEAHAKVSQLEKELTEFKETSPIYSLNHTPPLTPVRLTPAGMDLLQESHYLEALTDGSFSCKAKSDDPGAALAWDEASRTAWRLSEGTHVGFGAIGKGYALDQVRSLLVENGFEDFLLQAGGSSVILSGFAAAKTPWTWGWSWQKDAQGDPVGLKLSHGSGRSVALGVSGLQEKGNHIVALKNPERPLSHQSTLVACPRAAYADALSTAFFCSSWDEATEHYQELLEKPAMASIDPESIPKWNGLFQQLWGALALLLLWIPQAMADEDAIDLGSMGMDDGFMPYQILRQPWWALAPLIMLCLIALHLKDSRPKAKLKPPSPEDPL